jgi:outer membrane protein insertion porin family
MIRGAFGGIAGNAPLFERWHAGGPDTIRGFEYGHVGPHSKWDDRVALGGRYRALASLEYSMPVWQYHDFMVRAVGFVDSGSVGRIEDLGRWRVSAGAGLRLAHEKLGGTFLGVDLARAVFREDEDHEHTLSFFVAPRL